MTMKRKREVKRFSRPDLPGGFRTVEYYWYECPEGHTAAADTGICYDCLHLGNHANSQRVNNFYAKYGLNK